MKIYVVTADTYSDDYGSNIELLRVTRDRALADESYQFALNKGWHPQIDEVELDKSTRKYLGGYIE